eukprot:201552-Pyramimonas_sp.AAC.1
MVTFSRRYVHHLACDHEDWCHCHLTRRLYEALYDSAVSTTGRATPPWTPWRRARGPGVGMTCRRSLRGSGECRSG